MEMNPASSNVQRRDGSPPWLPRLVHWPTNPINRLVAKGSPDRGPDLIEVDAD
jgi:hypothetical protein